MRFARLVALSLSLACAACVVGSAAPDGAVPDAGASPLQVRTFSSDPSFSVNAHLVTGDQEAILVDTTFFQADAAKVVEMIRASGKTLTTVLLTHAHPDHYAGASVILKAFPGAKLVTTPAVLADFSAAAPGTFAYLKSDASGVKTLVADELATPTAIAGHQLLLEGRPLNVLEPPQAGESSHAALLALDNPKVLLTGDLLYNGVHLVVSECHTDGWRDDVEFLRASGYTRFYPGHGAVAEGPAALDAVEQYLTDAVAILDGAADADAAKAQLTAKYPTYQGAALLDFSVKGYLGTCRPKQDAGAHD